MEKMNNKDLKIIFTTAIWLLFFLQVVQSQEKKSFVGINAGYSVPIGKFSSTNLEDGSFALNGFTAGLEGAWFFKPRLGVGGSAGLNLNPVYVSALGWAKVVEDPFLQDVTIRSDPYLTVTAMAGVYTVQPIYRNFYFTGKLLGGLLYGKTPYQLYKPQYFIVGPPYYEITSAKDWKFSWKAGAGIQYNVSPYISLLGEAVLLYDKLSFNFQTASGIREDIHTISMINFILGVRIIL